jgi:NADP-dependent 3-hydroxy acid dehydrogenase YdfG
MFIMGTYEISLAGRVAVVTGASSGIGAATAQRLAADGAKVALLARRAGRLDELVQKITADGGTAIAVEVDITDHAALEAAKATVNERLGRVDLLVNNAGVMLPAPIADGRIDEWQRMIDLNLTGLLAVFRTFTPDLLAAAGDGPADVVNVSSIGAWVTFPAYSVYGATKAAVTAFSRHVRADLSPQNVRVTNIEPGLTSSELSQHISSDELQGQVEGMFEGIEALTAADVADVVAFVTSRPRRVNLPQIVAMPTQQA